MPAEFVLLCLENEELVREFDRLRGTNLSLRGSGLDLEIDRATGRLEHDFRVFLDFCKDLWERLPVGTGVEAGQDGRKTTTRPSS
jgi:hypothetical protein